MRHSIVFGVLVLLSAVLASVASFGAINRGMYWEVSIAELTIRPEAFDGEPVIVSGFLKDLKGADYIFTTRDSASMDDLSNAVWLDGLPPDVIEAGQHPSCHAKFATIHGTFRRRMGPKASADWAVTDIEVIFVYPDLFQPNAATRKICWTKRVSDPAH